MGFRCGQWLPLVRTVPLIIHGTRLRQWVGIITGNPGGERVEGMELITKKARHG
jgi:hypothetical protein